MNSAFRNYVANSRPDQMNKRKQPGRGSVERRRDNLPENDPPETGQIAARSSPEFPASRPVLRIVGGEFRGRQLLWSGDLLTRPMKDTVRESVFNLVGGWMKGRMAIDLFAGSGAIGLEAVSRGASSAILIERHFPTAELIRKNVETLGIASRASVVASDTFFWARRFLASNASVPPIPWAVFCSPPYDFYVSRTDEMVELIAGLKKASPPESVFVVESDSRLDPAMLPDASEWRVRDYAIARISVLRPKGNNSPLPTS
jgi:16S rRNA (guanine966-N2)-methyltransferase